MSIILNGKDTSEKIKLNLKNSVLFIKLKNSYNISFPIITSKRTHPTNINAVKSNERKEYKTFIIPHSFHNKPYIADLYIH